MPRTRYIKPDFFTDEDIAELPLAARLIFIGLWCHADRMGRLEDRPKFFKVALAPYDEIDIPGVIARLAAGRKPFLKLYDVNGKRYIQIVNFEKHQRPHSTEKQSVLPDVKKGITVRLALNNASVTEKLTESLILYNGDGDGDGDGNGEGEAVSRVVNDKREDKDKPAASHPSPAAPHFAEEDILRVAEAYCKLRFPMYVGDRTYYRGSGVFYPAKDLLAMNGGDVDRAILCLTHFNEHYTDKGKLEWNWGYVLTDFPKWDEGMRAIEAKEQKHVK